MSAPPPKPPAEPEGVVGREVELDVLHSFIERAGRGGEALVLVGDSGVGKTALLDMAARHAVSLGVSVVRAAGAEFESGISFSALHQSLLPLLTGIEELRPLYRDALSVALGLGEGPPPDRLVLSGAALDLVRRAGQEQPLLIVLDDVFWVDRPSAEVLGFVARRLAGSHVGVLAAERPATGTAFDDVGLPQYQLEPLSWEAADRLVRARFPILGPDMRRRLLAEAAGNPLALLELPAALSGRRPFASLGSAPLPLSARLSELFASRIEQLAPTTRSLLLLVALDNTGDLGALQRATGDAELQDLAPAERIQLVRVDPETRRLVFRHPLTRSAVVERSTAQERREAHRTLAEVRADEPQRQAWHLAEATIEPDERVAEMLEATARQLLDRGDPVGAATALTRAAQLSPFDGDRSRRLTKAAFVGVNMAGRLDDVEGIVAAALGAGPGSGASRQADVTAAFVLLNGDGDLDTVHRLLVRAIEAQGDELDATDEDLGAAIYLLLLVCGFAGRAELWAPYFAILDRLRPGVPEDLLLASRTMPDPVRDAVPVLDRLDEVIANLDDQTDSWHLRKVTLAAMFIDRLGGCRPAIRRMVNSSRETGAWIQVVSALNRLCLDNFLTGEWDELEQLLAECFEICEHAGLRLYVPVLSYDRALVAAARGDDALVRELTDVITDWAQRHGAHMIAQFASHARGLAAIGCGEFEEAYHHASAICPPGEFVPYTHHALWVCMDLVEAAVRTDRQAEAAAHVAAMRRHGIARISPRIALLAGGSAGLAERHDQNALAAFERALAIPGVDRWPFDLARVRLAYGERLRRARSGRLAAAELAAAHDAFQRLGATPWARRAAVELRATGQAPVVTSASDLAEPLTPQERAIANLAAAGLTNKQIGERLYLSHRTVGGHLYRIFPKLGIGTRAALRDALPSGLEADPAVPGERHTGAAGSRG